MTVFIAVIDIAADKGIYVAGYNCFGSFKSVGGCCLTTVSINRELGEG